MAVEFEIDEALPGVDCEVRVETIGRTGVEMEALTAVQIGLLTIYMSKAVDRGMVITDVKVMEKHGESREIGCWEDSVTSKYFTLSIDEWQE